MARDRTTIRVRRTTRDQIRQLGRDEETYDQILARLIEMAKRSEFLEDVDRIIRSEEFVSIE